MFAKLLKQEWKATRGVLGVLSLAVLGVGILGAIVIRIFASEPELLFGEDSPLVWLTGILVIMLVFMVIGIIGYVLGAQIILAYRFYKNKFTDEGYLTFTLPVSSKQIFLSSMVNILLWECIIGLVVLLVIAIMVAFGAVEEGFVNLQALGDMGDFFLSLIWEENGIAIAQMIVAPVYSVIMVMTSVTLGAVLAKKHKILAAFGMYYGISMAVSILTTVVTAFLTVAEYAASQDATFTLTSMTVLELVIQVGLAVGGFFLSTYLMKHKLNLP